MKITTTGPQTGDIVVMIGTRSGSHLFWSDAGRREWRRSAAHGGAAVHALAYDERDGRFYAAVNWSNRVEQGYTVEYSDDGGQSWQGSASGLEGVLADDEGERQIWQIRPGHPARQGELWAGMRAASLYRSVDRGMTWQPVQGLNDHPTRSTWMGGGGGLILHTILTDPREPQRLYACISAGGAFRSEDGGRHWQPINKGVRADFIEAISPERGCYPETGQCVHKMVLHPARPDVLFQQNHCGVYRSDDRGESWVDISAGLSSRFGFPIAIHPHDPQTVYVIPMISEMNRTAPDGQLTVWRSRDDGANWQPFTAGLPAGERLTVLRESLAVDPATPAGLYLGTTGGQVYASLDNGEHWQLVVDGLAPIVSVEAARAI